MILLTIRRDQRAVLLRFTACRSTPSPSRQRPFHYANRALVTSRSCSAAARAASFRLRSAIGVALRLRFPWALLSAPLCPLADRRPTLVGDSQLVRI